MLTDSVGGKWDFRPTIGALRRFERRTDIRLFSRLSKALPSDLASLGQMSDAGVLVDLRAVAEIFASVIDGIDSAAALLFECRVWAGDGEAPKPMSFDDFCERLANEKIGEALGAAVGILTQCVAGATATLSVPGVKAETDRPFSPGSTSTPSQG